MRETLARWAAKIASTTLVATALSPLAALPAHAAATTVANNITTADLASVGLTKELLASDIAGTGVTVSNVTYLGDPHQAGRVNITDGSIVSFNKGVIMSSGNIADIVGPNKSESTTGDMLGGQDADLTALIAASQTVYPMTYDAAVLEFDFVPNASDVYFTYVFGSEEYLEWVNLFNDVFGFWINNGTQKLNCALAQDGTPVSIDSINSSVNSNQYRDNGYWSPPTNPLNIESDGLTVEMICHASVVANQTNHIKLAIADTSDQILDSVVMIKTDSLSTVPPESCNNKIDDDNDTKTDMDDTQCSSTVTIPAPTSPSAGTGSGSNNPPFTGNEGEFIPLDGATVGYTPRSGVYSATWSVSQINTTGTPAVCDIYASKYGSPVSYISITPNQPLPLAYAVCPKEGEFVANVKVYPTYNGTGGDDWGTDVDFFIHNAPPQISLSSSNYQSVDLGTAVSFTTDVYEPGNDPYTCKVEWGDGTTVAVTVTTDEWGYEHCDATHTYTQPGNFAVGITATDNVGASASAGGLAEIISSLATQAITLNSALPASVIYGNTFTVSASGGASGNSLTYSSSGSCTNSGATYTMTDGSGTCTVAIDQAGNASYLAAPTYTATVTASKIALAIKANNATKVVGATDPALSYSLTSGTIKSGDSLTGNVARVAGETVGTYAINQGTLSGGTKYSISYTAGTFTITGFAPTISSFTPTSGGYGTVVTVTGTNFTGVTGVTFAGTTTGTTVAAAKFVVLSSTTLLATVPKLAGTGAISVTNATGTGKSATNFKASTTAVVPTVTSYSVTSTRTGTAVNTTLTGTNLGATASVALNGIALNFTVLSATTVSVAIPSSGIGSGAIKVTSIGGTSTNTNIFSILTAPASLTAGTSHSCAALSDGTAKCWGLNTNGQLGDGTLTQRTAPVTINTLTLVSSIAAGGAFTCAVNNGTVYCWGLNSSGQLGIGSTTQTLIPTATNITNAVKVVAGATHACALLSDATVKCWGLGTSGQLGNSASLTSNVPVLVTGLTSVISLAAGGSSTCAVVTGGATKCWGLNTNGQLGNSSTTLKNVATPVTGIDGSTLKATSVSVGTSHSCALLTTGAIQCWGLNSSGQLGDGTTTGRTAPVYVKSNATTSLSAVQQISAGATHTCAIVLVGSTNSAYCWGAGASGRLGNNATTNQTYPVASSATNSAGLTQIVAGGSHTLALVPSTLLAPKQGSAWGANTNGQLGDGTTTAKSVPTLIPLL